MNALALLLDEKAAREAARERNRARFTAAGEGLDMLNREFPCSPGTRGHRVLYAENFDTGERIGETTDERAKREGWV